MFAGLPDMMGGVTTLPDQCLTTADNGEIYLDAT